MPTVKQILAAKSAGVRTIEATHTVYAAVTLLAAYQIGALVVVEDGRAVGIFSERDYARKGIIQGRKAKSTPVTEVMTHNVYTVTTDMNMEDCMQLFTDLHIRHLPVMENGNVIGMLSIGDIVNAMIMEQKDHIEFLEKYIST